MTLGGRDRRALLVGAALSAVLVSFTGLAKPLWEVRSELRSRKATAAQFMARYRGILEANAAYAAVAETADARLSRLGAATYEGDPQVAGNRLLALLGDAAVGNDVRIMRASPMPADSVSPVLIRVGAALECESDMAGLLGVLSTLESSPRLLHLSGLRVNAANATSRAEIERLRFGFTVHAIVRVPGDGGRDAQATAE